MYKIIDTKMHETKSCKIKKSSKKTTSDETLYPDLTPVKLGWRLLQSRGETTQSTMTFNLTIVKMTLIKKTARIKVLIGHNDSRMYRKSLTMYCCVIF